MKNQEKLNYYVGKGIQQMLMSAWCRFWKHLSETLKHYYKVLQEGTTKIVERTGKIESLSKEVKSIEKKQMYNTTWSIKRSSWNFHKASLYERSRKQRRLCMSLQVKMWARRRVEGCLICSDTGYWGEGGGIPADKHIWQVFNKICRI